MENALKSYKASGGAAITVSTPTLATVPAISNPLSGLTPDQIAAAQTLAQQMVENGQLDPALANDPTILLQLAAIIADKTVIGQSGTDMSDATQQYSNENFVYDKAETFKLILTAFDVKNGGVPYSDIIFLTGSVGTEVTVNPGQVLYVSAGIYTVVTPNGGLYERHFGEETVGNDYFYLPGKYVITGYPIVTTLERGKFAAIGGKIFDGTPSALLELQGSYTRALDLHAVPGETGLRSASQGGMAKNATYSRFVLPNGEFETKSVFKADKVNVSLVGNSTLPAQP